MKEGNKMSIYTAICLFWLVGIGAVALLSYLNERGMF